MLQGALQTLVSLVHRKKVNESVTKHLQSCSWTKGYLLLGKKGISQPGSPGKCGIGCCGRRHAFGKTVPPTFHHETHCGYDWGWQVYAVNLRLWNMS